MIRSTLEFWYSGHTIYRNTGIPVKNTGIPVKTPILALIKNRIYSEEDLEKPRGQFPYSPKLVSFPCSLWRLVWVYAVCIGLFVPIFRFFKFLIRASFICISDEKRLYKMFVFLPKRFPAMISGDVPLRACGFLMRGKGNVSLCTFIFWIF